MTGKLEFRNRIDTLPIAEVLEELEDVLARHTSAVLVADPGAGKTTAVPLVILGADWLCSRRMVLLAPRRLAARAAARRMAHLLGEVVGETVGYRIRLESRVGPRTRIEVVTEGVLTRMLQSDPELSGVGMVIFDEFHERSLEADLALALSREVQGAFNPDLRLLVMSATLDPAAVTGLLGNAPLIRCSGRSFPVETRYEEPRNAMPTAPFLATVIKRSVSADEGNVLAFLPGAPEIRRVERLLADSKLPAHWDVVPLYGNLPRARQDAAIAPPPPGRGKIVLATAIAETSLTIEQIQVVVDSGLQRAPRFDPGSGMTRLVTLPVSRASADQRRGRAGRLGPGICYRLWSRGFHTTLAARNQPEILVADLTGLVLELALWGVASTDDLGWLDPPPASSLEQARVLLTDLAALDEGGRITDLGRRMARLPLHPRLARMVLAAQDQGLGPDACDLAALLSERDPLSFDHGRRDADLGLRMDALHAVKNGKPFELSHGIVDHGALRRIVKVAAMLCRRLGLKSQSGRLSAAGRLLAWAYPDRIANKRSDALGQYIMANGRGAYFDPPEPLCVHDFLAVARLDGERRQARIFMAAAYDRDTLMDQFGHRTRWNECVSWDEQRQAVAAERRLTLGALVLKREPLPHPDAQAVAAALLGGIAAAGLEILPWNRRLHAWRHRVLTVQRTGAGGRDWPDLSDEALLAGLESWLGPSLTGKRSLKEVTSQDLQNALWGQLTWRQQQLLDQLAPTHHVVPSGSRLPIDYSGDIPVLAVRIQEMFGAVDTPAVAGGSLMLQLHLLSPAGRPAQVTQDLAGFWRNSYPQVKKELKGRYPKHYWPDDPLSASPTARAKPRKK